MFNTEFVLGVKITLKVKSTGSFDLTVQPVKPCSSNAMNDLVVVHILYK